MKKLHVLCSIVIVALLALSACQTRGTETETVTAFGHTTTITTIVTEISWLDISTYNEFWGGITTDVGEEFAIALHRSPRLGLNWYETYDENLLVLLASDFKEYSTSSGNVEGDQYFIFKALNQGSTEITFVYSHSFPEAQVIEEKIFEVEIR